MIGDQVLDIGCLLLHIHIERLQDGHGSVEGVEKRFNGGVNETQAYRRWRDRDLLIETLK